MATDLTAVRPGDQLEDVFALVAKEPRKTRNGKPFITVTLKNATGSLSGPVWEDRMNIFDGLDVGLAVHVAGRVGNGYNGGPPQIEVFSARWAGEEHPVLDCLVDLCPAPLESLLARCEGLLANVVSPAYRAILDAFWKHGCPWEDYTTAPAALRNHHAYLHGLLEHSVEMTEMALGIARTPRNAERVDTDLLITAGLLHDAGKTWEYDWRGGPIRMSARGLLGNHMVFGPQMLALTVNAAKETLREAGVVSGHIYRIEHVMMSHHGLPEWGAVVKPKFIEAQILHNADLASAHTRKMLDAIDAGQPAGNGYVNAGFPFNELLPCGPVVAAGRRSLDAQREDPLLPSANGEDA
jgi:3'-5' exoribonuclease